MSSGSSSRSPRPGTFDGAAQGLQIGAGSVVGARAIPAGLAADERHRRAVASTLRWADESAAEGDFAGALAWLATLDAIREPLPDAYEDKRTAWTRAAGRSAR